MKCKYCNGTGTSNTCVNGTFKPCSFCDGTGEFDPNEVDRFNAVDVIKVMEMVKKPQTNEEWFCNLSTEEKAKVLRRRTYGNSEDNEAIEQGWVNWLKAKHEDNPPDIPSVPSWDKWLEGERKKCEYCDGISAECNLVGRFECPKTPKTEQEYIQSCNTEQLADLMSRVVGCSNCPIPKDGRSCIGTYSGCWYEIIKWLKQPHTDKE